MLYRLSPDFYFDKRDKKSLILFFTGWAMDNYPTQHLTSESSDVCTVWGHGGDRLPLPLLKSLHSLANKYQVLHLVGWSIGVAAAWRFFCENPNVPIEKTIFIYGTPYPVHDTWGIPRKSFALTLRKLTEETLQQFYVNSCFGNPQAQTVFHRQLPHRSLEECRLELAHILQLPCPSKATLRNLSFWHSPNDIIFPEESIKKYCQTNLPDAELRRINTPHFLFSDFQRWEEIIFSS